MRGVPGCEAGSLSHVKGDNGVGGVIGHLVLEEVRRRREEVRRKRRR